MHNCQMLLLGHLSWGLRFNNRCGNQAEVTSHIYRSELWWSGGGQRLTDVSFTEKWKKGLKKMIKRKS